MCGSNLVFELSRLPDVMDIAASIPSEVGPGLNWQLNMGQAGGGKGCIDAGERFEKLFQAGIVGDDDHAANVFAQLAQEFAELRAVGFVQLAADARFAAITAGVDDMFGCFAAALGGRGDNEVGQQILVVQEAAYLRRVLLAALVERPLMIVDVGVFPA